MKSLIFVFIFAVLIGFGVNVYMHEKVHQLIFEDYGIKSHVVYFNISSLDATTYPEGNTTNCGEMCIQAHEMNEITAYNTEGTFFMIALGIFIIICILIGIKEEIEYKNENSL
jgi:hypothetical protein